MSRVYRIAGPFWFHFVRYPSRNAPRYERGQTQETEFPWRMGSCLVIRLPLSTLAIVLVRWIGEQPTSIEDDETVLEFMPLEEWEKYV